MARIPLHLLGRPFADDTEANQLHLFPITIPLRLNAVYIEIASISLTNVRHENMHIVIRFKIRLKTHFKNKTKYLIC